MITHISDIETRLAARIKHTPQLGLREVLQIRPPNLTSLAGRKGGQRIPDNFSETRIQERLA